MNDEERRARLRPYTLLFIVGWISVVSHWFGYLTTAQVDYLLSVATMGMAYGILCFLYKGDE